MKLVCAAVLAIVLPGCFLNGGDCPKGFAVAVDAGTDGLPAPDAVSKDPTCAALCGATYYLCRRKDPTHVQCVPPCE